MAANWPNRTLFVADNIFILRGMNSASVDLIATDPPFNSKRVYNAPLGSRAAQQRFDDRWRWDEVTDDWQDVLAVERPAIKEVIEAAAVIEGGRVDSATGKIGTGRVMNSMAAFLAYMAPRVIEMHRVLKPTGVLFMQCDAEANAYLRLLLDAVFGRHRFINEIVRRRHASKGLSSRRLPRNHDTILAYSKGTKWKWNSPSEPYDLERLQRNYTKDEIARMSPEDQKTLRQYRYFDGPRRYRRSDLQNPNSDRPNLKYEFLGVTRVWRWTRERMEEALAAGRIIQTAPGNVPDFKRYLDEQQGRPLDDLWTDVVQVESSRTEWTTRKPISLYSRLIECATDGGDVVLDPFCGCATTLVAAEYLEHKREWVGIDIDPVAERETHSRLAEAAGLEHQIVRATVRKTLRRTDIENVSDAQLRADLWRRQAHRCGNPYCDTGTLRVVDLELDHRIPRVRGGGDDASNRIGLCSDCNRRKGRVAWGRFLDAERAKMPHRSAGPAKP